MASPGRKNSSLELIFFILRPFFVRICELIIEACLLAKLACLIIGFTLRKLSMRASRPHDKVFPWNAKQVNLLKLNYRYCAKVFLNKLHSCFHSFQLPFTNAHSRNSINTQNTSRPKNMVLYSICILPHFLSYVSNAFTANAATIHEDYSFLPALLAGNGSTVIAVARPMCCCFLASHTFGHRIMLLFCFHIPLISFLPCNNICIAIYNVNMKATNYLEGKTLKLMMIRVPFQTRRKLKKLGKEKGKSVSLLINNAISSMLNRLKIN